MMQETNNLLEKEKIIVDERDIKGLIYTIRGKQVMLDSDVARLYHCETKYVNRVVKRNIERFPEEFCFQLDENELENLRCQFVTSSLSSNYGGRRYIPYVFTEQGIAMLSALLKSDVAVKVSINIMKAFIEIRRFILSNGHIFNEIRDIKDKLLEHDKKIDIAFNELQKKDFQEFKQKIFYEGEIYDAYSLIIKILRKAKEKITIIDNYIDDTILDMLAKKNKNVIVTILTSGKSNIGKIDIQKFNKEYPTLEVSRTNVFHDRFIIIDNKELYHCGASLKDLGKKCFAINKMENKEFIDKMINN